REERHADLVARGEEGAPPMLAQYLVWAQVWGGELEPASQAAAAAVEAAELLDDPAVAGIACGESAARTGARGGGGGAAGRPRRVGDRVERERARTCARRPCPARAPRGGGGAVPLR